MIALRQAAAVFATAVLLAGCGNSTQARHEKIIRCTGFSIAMVTSDDDSNVRTDAEALVSKDGITASDTIPMGVAATEYGKTMDPAKVTALSQKGAQDAADLIGRKDAPGIANYVKDCVATYKSLGK